MSLRPTITSLVLACASVLASDDAQAIELPQSASATDLTLAFVFPPSAIESACDAGTLFGVESAKSSARWFCAVRHPNSSHLQATRWGWMTGAWHSLVRGPVDGDREILFVRGTWLWAFDPVTLVEREVANISQSDAGGINSARLFDRDGDGHPELLVNESGTLHIRSFPGGQLIARLDQSPWWNAGSAVTVGQFDADAAWELARRTNEGLSFYDSTTLQLESQVSVPWILSPLVFDWDLDGAHKLVGVAGSSSNSFVLVDPGANSVRYVGSSSYGDASQMTPIDWIDGGMPRLALLWSRHVAIVDPLDGSVVHGETIPQLAYGSRLQHLHAVDYDQDGRQDLIWTEDDNLRWLRNPSGVFNLQSALRAYRVLDGRGADGAIATLDLFADGQRLSLRDPLTLELSMVRAQPVSWSGGVLGNFNADPNDELVLLRPDQIAMQRVQDGAALWSRSRTSTGDEWALLTAPREPCAAADCRRLAFAENARSSASAGSRVIVLDAASGFTLFESERDFCLGCSYRHLRLADLDGDGVPELLTIKSDSEVHRDVLSVRDGKTHALLWDTSAQVLGSVRAIDVSSTSPRRIGVLSSSGACEVRLLDPVDGRLLTRRVVGERCSSGSIRYVPDNDVDGSWLIADRDVGLIWIDAALRGQVQTSDDVDGTGVLPLGQSHFVIDGVAELRRLTLPFDLLFSDGFELR